jgi:hypothetical protein
MARWPMAGAGFAPLMLYVTPSPPRITMQRTSTPGAGHPTTVTRCCALAATTLDTSSATAESATGMFTHPIQLNRRIVPPFANPDCTMVNGFFDGDKMSLTKHRAVLSLVFELALRQGAARRTLSFEIDASC